MVHSVVGDFSFLLRVILAMTPRLRVCRCVGVLYITYMWDINAVRNSEVVGSNAAVGYVILHTFRDSLRHSLFLKKTKTFFFSTKFRVFDNWALIFPKKIRFCCNSKKMVLPNVFPKLGKNNIFQQVEKIYESVEECRKKWK